MSFLEDYERQRVLSNQISVAAGKKSIQSLGVDDAHYKVGALSMALAIILSEEPALMGKYGHLVGVTSWKH